MSAHTAEERETIVRWSDADIEVRIWSSSPREIAKLRRDERFVEVGSEWFTDGGESADFVIERSKFVLTKAAKRRMTDEQKARTARNLAGSRVVT